MQVINLGGGRFAALVTKPISLDKKKVIFALGSNKTEAKNNLKKMLEIEN